MPYPFTNQGVVEAHSAAIASSAVRDDFVGQMLYDFRAFVKNNFTLSPEQQQYMDQLPDQLWKTIGRNLAHALDNGDGISINLGGLQQVSLPPYSESRVRCRLGYIEDHTPQCTTIRFWGVECDFE